jgi:hypothetical protein
MVFSVVVLKPGRRDVIENAGIQYGGRSLPQRGP